MLEKVNVLIVGLDRCPEICAPVLAKFFGNLFPESTEINYHIFLWLPRDGRIINSRSEEDGSIQRNSSSAWHQGFGVAPVETVQPPVEQVFSSDPFSKEFRARGDIYGDDFKTVANYFSYLNGLNCAAEHFWDILNHSLPAILLRPDLIPVNVDVLALRNVFETVDDITVYTPPWDCFSYSNDRIMVGSTDNVLRIMMRKEYSGRFLSDSLMFFHSEAYLHYCIRASGRRVKRLDERSKFARVRSNGKILRERYDRDHILSFIASRIFFLRKALIFRLRAMRETSSFLKC